jgi:hypothetical protein
MAVGHDRNMLEHERHFGRVQDLLLSLGLNRFPREENNSLVVYTMHDDSFRVWESERLDGFERGSRYLLSGRPVLGPRVNSNPFEPLGHRD